MKTTTSIARARGRVCAFALTVAPAIVMTISLAISLAILLTACGGAEDDAAPVEIGCAYARCPNIIVVTLDTTRADHLGCYGYFRDTSPVIDALAAESILFERCLAPMSTTLPSHLSLFTGTFPMEHGIQANIGQAGTGRFKPAPGLALWAEHAASAGYRTAAFVSAAPLKRQTGMADGFSVYEQPGQNQHPANETNKGLFRWLDGPIVEPIFLWVHYFDPHTPLAPPEPYDTMFERDAALESRLAGLGVPEKMSRMKRRKPVIIADEINLYDGEIRYMDEQIGKLCEKLKEKEIWDRAVLVIVGDHGEGLGQHGEMSHGSIWGEQLHVPLLIRVPGLPPRRVATPLSIVDVMPTMLGLVDGHPFAPFCEQTSGVDVLEKGYKPRPIFSQDSLRIRAGRSGPRYALHVGEWKFVHDPTAEDQLFHVGDDPAELENVLAQNPEIAAEFRKTVTALIDAQYRKGMKHESERAGKDEELDPELVRELKALGY